MFPGKRFFNHWVGSAVLEDYLGIYNAYRKRGMNPGMVVLGMEPWLLNARHGIIRWTQVYDDFLEMIAVLAIKPADGRYSRRESLNILTATVSLSYLWDSLNALRVRVENPMATAQFADDDATSIEVIRSDGSRKNSKADLERDRSEVNAKALIAAHQWGALYVDEFRELDPFYVELLRTFVRYLRHNGSRPVFYFAPLHPDFREVVVKRPDYAMALRAEAFFREEAARMNVDTVGTFDARAAGCSRDAFIDANHPSEACVARLFRRFRESMPKS